MWEHIAKKLASNVIDAGLKWLATQVERLRGSILSVRRDRVSHHPLTSCLGICPSAGITMFH